MLTDGLSLRKRVFKCKSAHRRHRHRRGDGADVDDGKKLKSRSALRRGQFSPKFETVSFDEDVTRWTVEDICSWLGGELRALIPTAFPGGELDCDRIVQEVVHTCRAHHISGFVLQSLDVENAQFVSTLFEQKSFGLSTLIAEKLRSLRPLVVRVMCQDSCLNVTIKHKEKSFENLKIAIASKLHIWTSEILNIIANSTTKLAVHCDEDVRKLRQNDFLHVTLSPQGKIALRKAVHVGDGDGDDDQVISINVGGSIFRTTRSTLMFSKGSILTKMLEYPDSHGWCPASGQDLDENGAFFFDRSPLYFAPILNFLRTGKLCVDPSLSVIGILEEAKFFQVNEVVELLEPEKAKRKHSPFEGIPRTVRDPKIIESGRFIQGSKLWQIKNFLSRTDRRLNCPSFTVGPTIWRLFAFPQSENNKISLFLEIDPEYEKQLPLDWSIFAIMQLSVLNVADKDGTKIHSIDTEHLFTRQQRDWGMKEMIDRSLCLHEADGFIKDGAITFVVDLLVQKPETVDKQVWWS